MAAAGRPGGCGCGGCRRYQQNDLRLHMRARRLATCCLFALLPCWYLYDLGRTRYHRCGRPYRMWSRLGHANVNVNCGGCRLAREVTRLSGKLYRAQELFREGNGRYAASITELATIDVSQHLAPRDYFLIELHAFEFRPLQNGWVSEETVAHLSLPSPFPAMNWVGASGPDEWVGPVLSRWSSAKQPGHYARETASYLIARFPGDAARAKAFLDKALKEMELRPPKEATDALDHYLRNGVHARKVKKPSPPVFDRVRELE